MPTSTSPSVLLAVAAAALGTLPRAAVGHGFMSFPIARNWQGRIDGKEYNPHGFQGGGPDTIKGRQAALGLGIGTEWLPNSEETVETAPRHPLCGDRAPAGEPYLAPQT